MTFIWPELLFSLLLVPLLIWLYVRLLNNRTKSKVSLGALGIVQSRSGQSLGRRRHLPPLIFLIGISILLFGLARPEMLVALPRIEGTVVLAFDVSNSMLAEDLEPTRLDAAKAAARTFVENQPSTIRIGVVAFSNGGLVVQPPTEDQAAVLSTIERLSIQGGTSLGQGIFTSLNAIAGEALDVGELSTGEGVESLHIDDYSTAVIVMLTDGENTSNPEPLDIAQLAAEAGVRIYPIGIGSEEGTVLEIEGYNVLTRLDEAALQEIAQITNGSYFHAEDAESLNEIYDNIDLHLTVRDETMEITSIVAGIGMIFLLIGGLLSLLWFGRIP